MNLVINTRTLRNPLTGVQRYLRSLLPLLGVPYREVTTPTRLTSALNQGWEQIALPAHVRGDLLWSPANTGPLGVRNQVLTLHDLAPLDHPEWYRPGFARYFSWLLPRLVRRVRAVITTSEFSRTRIAALTGVDPARITLVYNGVEEMFSPQPEAEIDRVRREKGIEGIPYVLYLGSIEPRKNLGRLLEAWAHCRSQLPPDLRLVIGGSRPNPKAFRDADLGESTGDTIHLGQVENRWIPALLSGAKAFVYPSVYEGFGLPPLEALACGTPTLTSSISSMPEVVGDAALTVDPFDVAALARGLVSIVNEEGLRSELREKGLARARRFTWEESAARTRSVIDACR